MRRKLIDFILILFFIGTLVTTARAQEKIIHVDSGISALYSVVWVGVSAGIFKKNGLDIEILSGQSTTTALQSILSGEAPIGNADTLGVLVANEKGADFVTFMNYQRTMPYELFVRKEIKTPQELKGKLMGITRFGGTIDHMSRVVLEKLELDPNKDVTFIQGGSAADRAKAMINNSIQAGLFSTPEPVILAKEPSVKRLLKLSDLGVVYPFYSGVTTRKYLKEHRDVIRFFVKGYLESLKFYATHKKESMEIISKRLRTKDEEALEHIHKTTLEVSYMKPYIPKDVNIIYKFAELQTKKPITVKWEETYDNSFVRELDESGFINKLFEGVTNVVREPAPHN